MTGLSRSESCPPQNRSAGSASQERLTKDLRVCRKWRARWGVICAYLDCYISKRHSFAGVARHCAYARPRSDPGAETRRLRNIPAGVSLQRCSLAQNRDVFCCPSNLTNKNPWGRTPQLNKTRSWSRREGTCGRISLRQYELCWPPPAEMNPAAHLRHLYFENEGLPPHEKADPGPAQGRTKLRTSMKSWSNWRQKCRLRKLLELDLAGKLGNNFVKAFEKQRRASRYWLLAQSRRRAMEDFKDLRIWTQAHDPLFLGWKPFAPEIEMPEMGGRIHLRPAGPAQVVLPQADPPTRPSTSRPAQRLV